MKIGISLLKISAHSVRSKWIIETSVNHNLYMRLNITKLCQIKIDVVDNMKDNKDQKKFTVKNDILETIGDTPIVKLSGLIDFFELKSDLYAKIEYLNPGGSIKDRIGISMVEGAKKEGEIEKGGVIIEPTSGNTGVGIAIASSLNNYKTVFTMPSKMSKEKELLLNAHGGKVIRTPTDVAPEEPNSYYSVAEVVRNLIWEKEKIIDDQELEEIIEFVKKLVEEDHIEELKKILNKDINASKNAYLPNQYENEYNPLAHRKTTGPEIVRQMGNELDYFFAGLGTGGTISGIGDHLRDNIKVKIIGVDPEGSIISLVKDGMKEEKAKEKAETYLTEGIGEDLIPETLDLEIIDEIVKTDDQTSFSMTRFLAREEGIMAGGSSGSVLVGAVKYLKRNDITDKNALVILPDTGRNYLTRLYDDDWMEEKGLETNDEKILEELR